MTVNGPNGLVVNFPDGTDPDTIHKVMLQAMDRHASEQAAAPATAPQEEMLQAGSEQNPIQIDSADYARHLPPGAFYSLDGEVGRVPLPDPGAARSALAGFVNGGTFGFAPRMRAGIRSALGMGNYDDELAAANQDMAAAEQNHPVLTGAGNIVGAIASPVKVGKVVEGAGMFGKMVNGVVQGGVAGGLFGASQAEDLGDIGDVASNAAQGAGLGAATGMVIAPAAVGLGKAYGAVADRGATKAAAAELGVPAASAARVGRAVSEDAAAGSLRAPSDGDMLLNLGPRLSGQAEAIAGQSGEGSRILADAAKTQAAGEGSRVKAVVDRVLGTDKGRVLDASGVDAERKAAGNQIKAAKQSADKFDLSQTASDLDARIDAADGPIADTLKQARKLKVFDGAPKTAEQLHQARVALDDMLEGIGKNPATSAGRNAKSALMEVRSAIDQGLKTVPGMAKADAAFSSAMKSKQALLDGRDVFTKSYGSPEELKSELAGMDPTVRARFIKGARDSITALMGSARNDAAAVSRELLEKGWNKEKLAVLVGPDAAGVIQRSLEQTANRAAGRDMLSGNAKSAMRATGKKDFPGPVSSGNAGGLVGGKGISGAAIQMLIAIANKASGNAINRSRAATSAGAAKLLASEGATRDDVLQVLTDAQRKAGRALNAKEQMAAVTQAFATRAAVPAVVGNGQSGRR
jgi:hypothetical protein